MVLTGLIKDAFGFQVMGLVVGATGLVFRYIGLRGVWNHAPRETPAAEIGLFEAFRGTLSNKQFLYFLPTFVMFQAAMGMTIAWMPFFVSQVMERENEGGATSLLTGMALLAMVISAFALWRLSNVKGKRWVYSACLLGTAA